jgi:glyceraldehyde-3-phosphate dehydrogenase/erythrose-4-phosphate dehydrogenase
MSVRLAINGFGRTGRSLLRAALDLHPELEVVAINDLGAPEALVRLFSRDSVHGRYPEAVSVEGTTMSVGDRRITMLAEPEAKALAASQSGRLARVLEYSDEPLVSSDIINSTASCVFDSQLTMAKGHLVKVLGWYDNECGYSARLADLAALVGTAPER